MRSPPPSRPLLLLLLLLHLAVCVVDAWNVGEKIPITLQLRQNQPKTQGAVPRDDVDEVDDDYGDEDAQNDSNLRTHELSPELYPRFAINSRMHPPPAALFYTPKNQTRDHLAIRFRLERGLRKTTTWLPLLKGKLRPGLSHTSNIDPENALYLVAIQFEFGYQSGTFNKITTFTSTATYSSKNSTDIELIYQWDERRAYNPHRAISVCAFAGIFASILALHMIFLRPGKYAKQFRSKQIIVRNYKQ